MLDIPNPLVALGFPHARSRGFFLAEIDTLFKLSEDAAWRVLDAAQQQGINHLMTGPAIAAGYHNEYPDTDWLDDVATFARLHRAIRRRGIAVSLVLGPDIPPYYDQGARDFDWAAMDRLATFYDRLRDDEGITPFRTVSQWEQWQRAAIMRRLFVWQVARWPRVEAVWHTPPRHLIPGDGAEEDRPSCQSALDAGIRRFYLQASPLDDTDEFRFPGGTNKDGRLPIDQMAYDLWDMQRRARGTDGSPWGGPLLCPDGTPLAISFGEGLAHPMYWQGVARPVIQQWAAAALSVVDECLDGLP